jgi:Cys-tRNA(Pro) deacylase
MALTPATQLLKKHGISYSEHRFEYKEHGGTEWSSEQMGVPEHAVVKTLVFENEAAQPLIVLMHGDCKVSAKELARQAGFKKVAPCKPEVATRHSGYMIGGTSPFGTRKAMPIYIERSIFDLPRLYINGGQRGYLVGIPPAVLSAVLANTHWVDVALKE